ncbi:DUF938 domain-containing protein [Paraglaciecola sp.]|uniref:DUF938 domain-containing protein n=1 Tax=Paraglaciecola sp. TaxID=1920173 RepID=UPI003EF358C4
MHNKPFSQACENNKQPIWTVLQRVFSSTKNVLEIGSGTGQHATYFAVNLPHLIWQTSDLAANHTGIQAWLSECDAPNLKAPVIFQLGQDNWPDGIFDAVFTANSTHIMQPNEAKLMMEQVGMNLPKRGVFCQYGPFNINGQYTSHSNRDFDQYLKEQGCGGIRSIEELQGWAVNLDLIEKVKMPANNMLLVWRKQTLK